MAVYSFSKIRICIFDFDGTLIDTMGKFADIAAELINFYYGISFDEARTLYVKTSGIPFYLQVDKLFPNRDNSKLVIEFENRKKQSFFLESFTDDVKHSIFKLRNLGFKLAISSGNFQNLIEEFLLKESILFDFVLGFTENCFKGRGHFDFIKNTENYMNDNMLFVGDSLFDARQAIEYNIPFLAKVGTFQKKDFLLIDPNMHFINKISDILLILN